MFCLDFTCITGCNRSLRILSGEIKDWRITVRPFRYYRYKPSPVSLLLEATGGAGDTWKPYWFYRDLWFQVELHNGYTWVTGIATQGRLIAYALLYWDCRVRMQWYTERGQRHAKIFTGNRHKSFVRNKLKTPIRARFFRIYPLTWRGMIEMRMKLYGCKGVCLSMPCKNGGKCVPDYINENYTCVCPDGFYGDTCRLGDLCKLSKPCLHGGNCSAVRSWPYFKCTCPSNYTGFDCGFEIVDACFANPCLNNGTCTLNNNSLGFECSCPLGYIGFNCGFQAGNPCSNNSEPCKNGGNCTQESNILGYTCKCTSEYIGFNCGFMKDDPCFPNPCRNGGNCFREDGLKDFICNCTFGFIGKRCESEIVHGNWSQWTPWPNCNKPCNNGTRTRRRACDNPRPAFGGKRCEGLTFGSERCNQEKCPAENVKYQVKLRGETWEYSLAEVESTKHAELADRIKKAVKDFYHKRDENVKVDKLKFKKGSVICSFNVTYESIDSLQIVSFLEEIAGGLLGDIPVALDKIETSNVPQQAPVDLEAKSSKSTSIVIKWRQNHSFPTLGNMIVYKEANKKFKTNTMKSVPLSTSEAMVEDLKKFTNYTIRVFAFSSNGNGVPSDAVTVRTQEDVPSEPPSDIVVKSTSSSTIHVSWGPISQAFVHGILMGYEVSYAKDDDSSAWDNKTVDANAHETVLSDLEYFTPYKVVICARTSQGCGKNVSRNATTFGDVPSKPPQNVTTWNEVPFGHVNGLLMGYSIKYRRVKTAEKNVVHLEETAIAKSTDLWIVLNVQTYSVYIIEVAAFTQKGLGPYSEYIYGETCRCPKTLYTNYWSTPPYLKVNLKGNTLDGIFSHIVTDMIYTACGECPAYGFTEINLTSNGNGQRSGKESLVDVLGDIDEVPQISFPIYGNRYVTRFGGVHPYVNLVESPGLAFVAAKRTPGAAARNIVSAVFSCFPLVLLSACMAFLSGFIIWLLIGAIQNSTEHRIGTLKNARVNEEKNYKNLEEIRAALEDGEIEGALIDTYVAADHKSELFSDKIYVKQILDQPLGYGVVLSGAAVNVEQRCRDFINLHMSNIFHMITISTMTLDPTPPDEKVESSTDLFDGSSVMFRMALASLSGMLGLAIIAGITVDRLKASSSQLSLKKALVAEMRDFVRIFHSQMSTRISSEMDKCKQILRDIREERNISKQGGALLLNNVKTNPIYSDASEGCDSVVAQRPLVFKSAKSIEELNKHNTFVNRTAALNSSGENLSLESDSDNCTK
ncbi:unnamed protein product [Pocillopora meandrina]|uniref:Uncharacterized protein n=1 Tax=Pocillopora meandrina TaxID=46732 RepID=A0AAU9XYG4_9CNID|nr:unnamed protein product [Pocillopora meandrina]